MLLILGPILDKGESWVEIEKHTRRQLIAWKTVLERQKVMEIGPTLTPERLEQLQKSGAAKLESANSVVERYRGEMNRINEYKGR